MSRSSDLHLLLSEYERDYGRMEEEARRDFAIAYSKGLLPHQRKRERFPADDEQPQHHDKGNERPQQIP